MKFRIILSLIITLALVSSVGIYVKADPDDNPGQIIDNPFSNLFTSAQSAETTTEKIGDIVTNPWGEQITDSTELPSIEPYTGSETRVTTTQVPTATPTKQPVTVETTKMPNPIPAVKVPGKVKVKKVSKKKSAKKLKVRFKKAKGAKGYQVAIYKSKKKAKNNKKALVKKITKKTKITIKSKKLKNKKKLFVKVRAYVLNGKKKEYGPWSKIKRVKIKK